MILLLAALLSSDIETRLVFREAAPATRMMSELGVFRADSLLVELGGMKLIAPLPPPTAAEMPGCNVGRYEDTRGIATAPEPSPSATADDAGATR